MRLPPRLKPLITRVIKTRLVRSCVVALPRFYPFFFSREKKRRVGKKPPSKPLSRNVLFLIKEGGRKVARATHPFN